MSRAMKDSGITWIGEIPEEWEISNIRHHFSFGKGLPITKDDLREMGIPVISYGQIHSKHNSGTPDAALNIDCQDIIIPECVH